MRNLACLSFLIVALLFPASLLADTHSLDSRASSRAASSTDTLAKSAIGQQQEQDKKEQTPKKDVKDAGNKQIEPIKQVPKSRKQLKPTVVKPNIKVKPIKIIRPKIKKP